MSNFLIFKANFDRFATPAIGTYTVEGGNPQFIQKLTLSPDYYMYVATAENPVKWFVPTAAVTDFEFVCDILTRDSNAGYAPYFTIADSNGVTRLRMESQYRNIRFMSDDTHGQSSSVICLTSPTDIGGYGKFHQFRIRIRKLTDSSSSVEVYANDNLVTSGTSPALITCGKISFLGATGAFVTGDTMGVKNAYIYDLSGGDVIDRGVLSGAFNRFISWMKSKFALKSDIPTVNNATLTIQRNGTTLDTFTANASVDKTINISTTDDTKIPLAGSNAISGDLIPSTNGTVNLGSASYQWNNAYIKSLTINGVACGDILTHNTNEFVNISSNQTIAGVKTFSDGINNKNAQQFIFNKEYSDATDNWLGIHNYLDKNSTRIGFYSIGDFSGNRGFRWYVRGQSTNSVETDIFGFGRKINETSYMYINATLETDLIPTDNNSKSLGSSSNKWKSLNGINPGALSLPSVSSGINLDLTNFKIDGSDNKFCLTDFSNYPYDNGWLFVSLNGCTSYYLDHWYKVVSDSYTTPSEAIFFLPINDKDHEITLKCVCTSINYIRVFPCQGNV